MKLVWARPALADRVEIREYIARNDPAAAIALDRLISEKAARLAEFPNLGRVGRVSDTRELVVHRNYILIYDIDGQTVRILRLLHVARQWPPG